MCYCKTPGDVLQYSRASDNCILVSSVHTTYLAPVNVLVAVISNDDGDSDHSTLRFSPGDNWASMMLRKKN